MSLRAQTAKTLACTKSRVSADTRKSAKKRTKSAVLHAFWHSFWKWRKPHFFPINVFAVWALRIDRKYKTFVSHASSPMCQRPFNERRMHLCMQQRNFHATLFPSSVFWQQGCWKSPWKVCKVQTPQRGPENWCRTKIVNKKGQEKYF